MDTQQVFTFGQQSLYMLLMVSAPILLTEGEDLLRVHVESGEGVR